MPRTLSYKTQKPSLLHLSSQHLANKSISNDPSASPNRAPMTPISTTVVSAFLSPAPAPNHKSTRPAPHRTTCPPVARARRCRRGVVALQCLPASSRDELERYVRSVTSGSDPDLDRVRALLDGRKLTLTNAQLLIAARMGDEATVRVLIAGAGNPETLDVNVQDVEGSTPLMRAASRGHAGVVRALLETGKIDLDMKNNWGYDAVIYMGSVQRSQPAQFAEMVECFRDFAPEADLSRIDLRWTQKPKKSS